MKHNYMFRLILLLRVSLLEQDLGEGQDPRRSILSDVLS